MFPLSYAIQIILCFLSSAFSDILSPSFSCFSYPNSTCIPRQTVLYSVAGQSEYLLILPKRTGDAGPCVDTCAISSLVSAAIGNINASVAYDTTTGFFLLEWKEPYTYRVSGKTSLRAFIGGDEISNSPLSVTVSPGPESLTNLLIYGAGSSGGPVNSSISL